MAAAGPGDVQLAEVDPNLKESNLAKVLPPIRLVTIMVWPLAAVRVSTLERW